MRRPNSHVLENAPKSKLVSAIESKNIEQLKAVLDNEEETRIFIGRSGKKGRMQDNMVATLVSTADEAFIEEALPLLLQAGANLNSSSWQGNALSYAVEKNLLKTAQLLLDSNIVNIDSHPFNNPLVHAIANNNGPMLKLLVENDIALPVSAHYEEMEDYGLLSFALERFRFMRNKLENTQMIDYLFEEFFDIPEVKSNEDLNQVVLLALQTGSPKILHLLDKKLKASADIELHDLIKETMEPGIMEEAIRLGHTEHVKCLIEFGFEINKNYPKGRYSNKPYLLQALNVHNDSERINIINLLLDNGADINTTYEKNATALILASIKADTQVVELLLTRGADVTVRQSTYGNDALNMALFYKKPEVVKLLLKNYPDINKPSNVEMTPLLTAIGTGEKELVEMVLEKNPDPYIGLNGKSAREYAKSKGLDEIVKMLKDYETTQYNELMPKPIEKLKTRKKKM